LRYSKKCEGLINFVRLTQWDNLVSRRQTLQQFWCSCLACCRDNHSARYTSRTSPQLWVLEVVWGLPVPVLCNVFLSVFWGACSEPKAWCRGSYIFRPSRAICLGMFSKKNREYGELWKRMAQAWCTVYGLSSCSRNTGRPGFDSPCPNGR
jgi:hypothetical protein